MSLTEVRSPRRREQLYQAGMAEELAPLKCSPEHEAFALLTSGTVGGVDVHRRPFGVNLSPF